MEEEHEQYTTRKDKKTHEKSRPETSPSGLPEIFSVLQENIGKPQGTFFNRLERVLLGGFTAQEKDRIKQLLNNWNMFEVGDLMDDVSESIGESDWPLYKKAEILSARVYSKSHQYIKSKRIERSESEQGGHWNRFSRFIFDNDLKYSYNRYFWARNTLQSRTNYGYKREEDQDEEQQLNTQKLLEVQKEVEEYIKKCEITPLQKLYSFMKNIGLIASQGKEIDNVFLLKLQRIGKQDQRDLFIGSIACEAFENVQLQEGNKFGSQEQGSEARKSIQKSFRNYRFYSIKEENKGICLLHLKFQDYTFLENRHDYIQWMFPNHYGSAFNSQSSPLSYLEKRLFLDDSQVGLRLLISLYIFLDFMGIRLDLHTLQLSVCSKERLRAVILVHYHNHLRIMRLLACLSVVGFRDLALKLIQLLDIQTSPGHFLAKERRQFEISWGIYGNMELGVPKQRAKNMCFLEEQAFPSEHSILTLLKQTNKQLKNIYQEEPSNQIEAQEEIVQSDQNEHRESSKGQEGNKIEGQKKKEQSENVKEQIIEDF